MCIPNEVDFVGDLTADSATLNGWLSSLTSSGKTGCVPPQGIKRDDIILELEKRHKDCDSDESENIFEAEEYSDTGNDTDWREYEDENGFTHLEELFIYQPKEWKEQARELFFKYRFNLERKSTPETQRTRKWVTSNDDIFMDSPVLVVLFHPDIPRSSRYEPLAFLRSYQITDPRLYLYRKYLHLLLSPCLDYILKTGLMGDYHGVSLLAEIGKASCIPRLPLLNELTYSPNVVGQDTAKSVIRGALVTHFWDCCCGFSKKDQPLVMMFLGDRSVGKATLAQDMAELLGGRDALYRVDLSSASLTSSSSLSDLDSFVDNIVHSKAAFGVVLLDNIGFYDQGKSISSAIKQAVDRWTSSSDNTPCNIVFVLNASFGSVSWIPRDQLILGLPAAFSHTAGSFLEVYKNLIDLKTVIKRQCSNGTEALFDRINIVVPFHSTNQEDKLNVAKFLVERKYDSINVWEEKTHQEKVLSPVSLNELAETAVGMMKGSDGMTSLSSAVDDVVTKLLMHKRLVSAPKAGGCIMDVSDTISFEPE